MRNGKDFRTGRGDGALHVDVILHRQPQSGEEAGQGVGYLDDGTMVVVEHGRAAMNREIDFIVPRSLQTSAGRMIFGKAMNGQAADAAVH